MRLLPARGLLSLVGATFGGTALVAAGAVLLALAAATSGRAAPGQVSSTGFLPNVVSNGHAAPLAVRSLAVAKEGPGERMLGVVGFGESVVELQSMAAREVPVDLRFHSTSGYDDVQATVSLGAGSAGRVALRDQQGITYSNYSLVVSSEGPVAALARTQWSGGAAAVYEAPPAGTRLVLPLVARDVYSHTSVIWMQDTNDAKQNHVLVELFDDLGSLAGSWTFVLEPRQAGRLDLAYQDEFSGLPTNAGLGFLGAFHISADLPIAVMAFGDEPLGRGAAALTAMPESSASAEQWLPYVRSSGGRSLIAVANVSSMPVDVTIAYFGFAGSSAAGQTFEQDFQIGPRSQAFVDLDSRLRRGNRPAPPLPSGFLGSAVVRATQPVLAAVLDQQLGANVDEETGNHEVLTSFAYNGYGTDQLGSTLAVPHANYNEDGYFTHLAVQNPSDAPVAVTVSLRDSQGKALGADGQVTVSPGGGIEFPVVLPAPGSAQVLLSASAPVAVLALDTSDQADWTAYRPVKMPAALIDVPTPRAPDTATPTATRPSPTPTVEATRVPTNPAWQAFAYLPMCMR